MRSSGCRLQQRGEPGPEFPSWEAPSQGLIGRTDLLEVDQCGLTMPKVDLHLYTGLEIDDRSDCCLFDSSRHQPDNYTVTDMVWTIIGFSLGGHRLLTMTGIVYDSLGVFEACWNPLKPVRGRRPAQTGSARSRGGGVGRNNFISPTLSCNPGEAVLSG